MSLGELDSEHWRRIWALMEYQPTEDDLVRAEAAADQIEAAMREAERWDCSSQPGRYFGLKQIRNVTEKLREVMTLHHIRIPDADFGGLQEFVEMPRGDGAPLQFDRNDSRQWSGGLFGLLAGNERRVHVLRGEYSVPRWVAEEKDQPRDCEWDGPLCAEYTRDVLTFSYGAYVIGVPTCFSCERWLVAGGGRNTPVTHLGV